MILPLLWACGQEELASDEEALIRLNTGFGGGGPTLAPQPDPEPEIITALHAPVGRLPGAFVTGDFDGDGVLDQAKADGETRIWMGATHATPSGRVVPDVARFERLSTSQLLSPGHVLAVGDFDGDGRDDLVIGEPDATVSGRPRAGRIHVHYGADLRFGIFTPSTIHQGSPGIKGAVETDDHFGEFLAAGDFDCDGADDLAIGIPQEDDSRTNNGYVQVLYGMTGTGLTARDTLFHAGYVKARQPWAQFGASVAAAPGTSGCDLLIVGAPGENLGHRSAAGAIYAIPGAPGGLSFATAQHITQRTPFVRSKFGSEVGVVSAAEGGGIWASNPGRPCGRPDQRFYHHFRTSGTTVNGTGDRLFCSLHAPGLIDREAGTIRRKVNRYGTFWQYVPQRADGWVRFLVLVHGRPCFNADSSCDGNEDADRTAKAFLTRSVNDDVAGLEDMEAFQYWIDVAERENIVLVAPVFNVSDFDHYHHGWGRVIDADRYVADIVDSYTSLGHNPSGTHYLYGHSSGGQFTTRYLVKQPGRLIAAAFSSPNTVASPDPSRDWPYGMDGVSGVDKDYVLPDGSEVTVEHSYSPSPASWRAALEKPIFINVGEMEQGCFNPNDDDDAHVQTAIDWAADSAAFSPNHQTQLCILQDLGHSSRDTGPWAVQQLFPTNSPFALPCLPIAQTRMCP